jgi:hypothetical protein
MRHPVTQLTFHFQGSPEPQENLVIAIALPRSAPETVGLAIGKGHDETPLPVQASARREVAEAYAWFQRNEASLF